LTTAVSNCFSSLQAAGRKMSRRTWAKNKAKRYKRLEKRRAGKRLNKSSNNWCWILRQYPPIHSEDNGHEVSNVLMQFCQCRIMLADVCKMDVQERITW